MAFAVAVTSTVDTCSPTANTGYTVRASPPARIRFVCIQVLNPPRLTSSRYGPGGSCAIRKNPLSDVVARWVTWVDA